MSVESMPLEYGSELHTRIKNAVLARKKLADNKMANFHKRWEMADEEYNFYMTEREMDRLRKVKRDDEGSPQFVDIKIPSSYAMLMSAHTHWASVFLSRSPILQFAGRHGESEDNILAVEALMEYQTTNGRHLPPYYVWLLDAGKYGLGVVWSHWAKEESTVSNWAEEPVVVAGLKTSKTKRVRKVEKVTQYEGNRTFNVRPADYLPDPRVPISDPDAGEFVGRRVEIGYNNLARGALQKQYINVEKVRSRMRGMAGTGHEYGKVEWHTENLPDGETSYGALGTDDASLVSSAPCVEMLIEIIPKEWKLGTTEHPEVWVFTLAFEDIVIEAHPYGMYHGKFPAETLLLEPDAYNLIARGMLEIGRPLNNTLDWLVNTHFHNVRKSLNGEFIYDPTKISSRDILTPGDGKRIRLKPAAYGQDIRTFFHTIQGGTDITGTHLRDTQLVDQMLQKVLGVSDNAQGAPNSGGRKTATEVRSANGSSAGRMKVTSEYMSAMGFAPLAQKMLQVTQQMYDEEKKFKIAGSNVQNVERFINVTPDMIAGSYDYLPVDGTMPVDRFAQVTMWTNLIAQSRNFPQFAQQYDVARMVAWVAQLGGLKNINQFKLGGNAGDARRRDGK